MAALSIACSVFQAQAELIDGLIAHWPLDEVTGKVTPELVNGYNMELVNLSADDLIGHALQRWAPDHAPIHLPRG